MHLGPLLYDHEPDPTHMIAMHSSCMIHDYDKYHTSVKGSTNTPRPVVDNNTLRSKTPMWTFKIHLKFHEQKSTMLFELNQHSKLPIRFVSGGCCQRLLIEVYHG